MSNYTIPAVSLWQPWASLVAFEEKIWETRGRRMFGSLIGQELAIASTKKSPDGVAWEDAEWQKFAESVRRIRVTHFPGPEHDEDFTELAFPDGCVLCTVRVIQEVPAEQIRDRLSARELAYGNYSDGRFATRLKLTERFETPIPCKGAQGIWRWEHPDFASTPPLAQMDAGAFL